MNDTDDARQGAWDALLLSKDRDLITASAIAADVAQARGYRSVTETKELRALGFSHRQSGLKPALIIPIHDVTGAVAFYQMRPHEPDRDAKGKARKYEMPPGAPMVVDVPPVARERLGDPTVPLWITEGVRKADSAVSHGLCCIDVLGVFNFRGKNASGGLTVLADWEHIALNERQVNIVFDSDVMTKPPVRKALARTGAFLKSRKATVGYVYLPSGDDGSKVGLDDFFAAGGTVDALCKLIRPDLLPSPGATTATASGERQSLNNEDFFAHLPDHSYIHRATRKPWVKAGVDSAVPPVYVGTDDDGEPKYQAPSLWLDQHRAVHQQLWAPGLGETVDDWVMNEGGWLRQPGARAYNLYQPPTLAHGDADKAGPWVKHIERIYPEDAPHILRWIAQRVQDPATKINHALVLGGAPGIGKDTMLAPVSHAVGPWNLQDVSPSQVVSRFNRFLRSVILRVSEARDLGDVNRYGFYEAMKPIEAAPPDTLHIDEKFISPYYVRNCCGVIYTTNNRTTGLYLPADDRRHYVAWSDAQPTDFEPGYWTALYEWFDAGGNGHVAAYLAALDLSDFDPKAPPVKTPAFWAMVDASRAPEEGDLSDLIDALGNPAAVTLGGLCQRDDAYTRPLSSDLVTWLRDRKNARQVPHRMEAVGYIAIRNDSAKDGLWKIDGRRQAVYARADLSRREQIAAAQALGR